MAFGAFFIRFFLKQTHIERWRYSCGGCRWLPFWLQYSPLQAAQMVTRTTKDRRGKWARKASPGQQELQESGERRERRETQGLLAQRCVWCLHNHRRRRVRLTRSLSAPIVPARL